MPPSDYLKNVNICDTMLRKNLSDLKSNYAHYLFVQKSSRKHDIIIKVVNWPYKFMADRLSILWP